MAFSASVRCPSLCRLPKNSISLPSISNSISFRYSPNHLSLRKPLSIRAVSIEAPPTSGGIASTIALTDNALKHLNKMRSEKNEDLCLKIGVKQGGCSGMSYTMEFESRENARPDDSIIEYYGFVIDELFLKESGGRVVYVAIYSRLSSLRSEEPSFIFGMQLDYSDALIGGGFTFKNPNATQTCGCGKSFAAEM